MKTLLDIKDKICTDGFAVIDSVFNDEEIKSLLLIISQADISKPAFRKTNDLFAIRLFLKELPATVEILLNKKLKNIITRLFSDEYFAVKSIYFDKPPNSNWFVSYHQDLTISVDKKINIDGFSFWTLKQNQYSVQPPINILEDNFTIRIHLDKTVSENGALKVIPKSHLKGICRPATIDFKNEIEISCSVEKGGIMIMKPLLLHSSGKTINNNKRRVVHIEFSRSQLPSTLNWSEKII